MLSALATTQSVLQTLRADWKTRFGFVYLKLKPQLLSDGRIDLTGQVLFANQKKKILSELAKYSIDVVDHVEIAIEQLKWTWVKAATEVVALREGCIATSRLWSEARAGEWLKLYLKHANFALVESDDKTFGWVQCCDLVRAKPAEEPWTRPWFALSEHIPLTAKASLQQTTRQYLETPYLLGGKTTVGWDCSAFVQQVMWEVYGHLLPRHSWDQKNYGQAISEAEIRPGDLVFALSLTKHTKHVGIYLGNEDIVHASRRAGKTVIWKLPLFEMIYQVVVVRRLTDRN